MSKKQDKIKDTILRSTENAVASVADDNVKANMEVETGAGMEPKILRSSDGKCCAWCSALAGEYYADEAPDGIYARHDNCNCTVTYISEKGFQDAHTKKWINQQELSERRNRIEIDKNLLRKMEIKDFALHAKQKNHVIIVTSKQFGKKIGEHAREWGLDKSNSEDRRKLTRIIQDILYTDDVRKGRWRGQDGLVKFYVKGKDAVVVNNKGQFVTILKGGVNNARIKNARRTKI
ncbi:colicin D domain-containing protein [Hornefia butyriciproducens]|uniref:VG15 protein n=1 Tax=Hornefia butyriciproducens TaxID=2652293 RepID=UPI0023F069E9|nr:colicin D domain-containing protein [Hornefia butyriciproducens]MDD6299442.1 colicin D domain-containing protein [Hornefia butyriciproducens]